MLRNRLVLFGFILMGVSLLAAETNGGIDDVRGPGGYAITAYDRSGDRNVAGYFDTEFVSDKNSSTFKAHRLVLETSAQLHKNLLFNSEIEFEYGAKIEGDSTDTDGELKVEQAWFDQRFNDAFFVRSGIVLIPVGRANILHDSDVRETTDRGIFAKYIVPTTWMDTGVGAHGVMEYGDWLGNYEVYVVNGLNSGLSSTKGIRSSRPGFKTDNNLNKAIVGRIGLSPYQGLDFGTSLYTGKTDASDAIDLTLFALDFAWKQGATEVIAEWAQIDSDTNGSNPVKATGLYVEGRYHMSPEWLKAFMPDYKRPTITLFGRVDQVDLDTSVSNEYDITQYTIGFNVRPIENVVYKFEYQLNDEKENSSENDQFLASIAVGF